MITTPPGCQRLILRAPLGQVQVDDVTLRVGSATQSPGPVCLAEIEELAALLRDSGRSVTVEEVERIPGRYGVIWAETLAIYIGSAAGSSLIAAIVYGPDGEPILFWKISYEGEEETVYKEIENDSGD
jgi:hypothetical protein